MNHINLRRPGLLFLILLIITISCTVENGKTIDVKYAGALKNMMKKGDISPKISLQNISNKENLYALGAIAELKGEIQIFDGQPLLSYEENGEIAIDTSFNKEATLLVYSQVPNWIEFPIDQHIKSMDQLEAYVKSEAINVGINANKPFPFLINGNMESLNWHIINWKEGDNDHTHEKHITSGPHGQLKNVNAEILGFYSDHHKGIFTHHSSNMHLHAKIISQNIAGHIDDLRLGTGCVLKLPSVTN